MESTNFISIFVVDRLPYNPRFASTPAEIDHWMRFIDDHISDEMAAGEPLVIESYPGGGPTDPCSGLVNDLVDRVEVLYVLGLLLVGKHRKQVQKELAELQLIPKLSNLFDNFIWRSNGGRQRTRLPGEVIHIHRYILLALISSTFPIFRALCWLRVLP